MCSLGWIENPSFSSNGKQEDFYKTLKTPEDLTKEFLFIFTSKIL